MTEINIKNTLNIFIFKEVSVFLCYNSDIKSILEYSLLSKTTFKLFQNIISSYDFNKSKSIVPSLDKFLEYIKSKDGVDEKLELALYKFKLIQYKEIESLRFKTLSSKFDCYWEKSEEKNTVNENQVMKEDLLSKCSNLKKVVITVPVRSNTSITYDYTCDGFFKVKKLVLYWDREELPLVQEEEDFDYDDDEYEKSTYFSFNYISKYNPSKILITTCWGEQDLHLENLENVLKVGRKTIKKVNFCIHSTPIKFIKECLIDDNTDKKITSLSIRIREKVEKYINELEESGISNNNTTLKKLLFRSDVQHGIKYNNQDPIQLLELLKTNKTLKSLGLNVFRIKDHKLLSPLKEIPNITKLYCDHHSLEAHLEHCKENKNIKQLYCFLTYDYLEESLKEDQVIDEEKEEKEDKLSSSDNAIRIFSNYFKSSNSTPSSLVNIIIRTRDSLDRDIGKEILEKYNELNNPSLIFKGSLEQED